MFNTPNGLNCLMSNSSSDPISYSSLRVHLLLWVWKSDAYQSPETYYSLFLIIFYGLIFCLIDFSCSSLPSRLRRRPLRSPTTQWHRQLRQLVNPDKEAGRTSHFDIYTAVFTTRVYNLCPFYSLFFRPSSRTLANWTATFTCRLWQKEVTGVNHGNLAFVCLSAWEGAWGRTCWEDTHMPCAAQNRHFIGHLTVCPVLFVLLSVSEQENSDTGIQTEAVTEIYTRAE